MKIFKIKNYKGNLVESLSKFQESHKDMKIVEVCESESELKIKIQESEKVEEAKVQSNNYIYGKQRSDYGDPVWYIYFKSRADLVNFLNTDDEVSGRDAKTIIKDFDKKYKDKEPFPIVLYYERNGSRFYLSDTYDSDKEFIIQDLKDGIAKCDKEIKDAENHYKKIVNIMAQNKKCGEEILSKL